MKRTAIDEVVEAVPNETAGKLTDSEASQLREWVGIEGILEVSEVSEVSRESIARGIAGMGLRRGTLVMLRTALEKRGGK